MLIRCNSCNKEFNIPEEKLPNVKKFAVKCPNCGEKIVVNMEQGKKEVTQKQDFSLDIEPEMYPPGALVVFVYGNKEDYCSNIESFFKQKGYIISRAKNIDEALGKLRINRYNIICFLDDEQGDKIREEIATWTGRVRREINVICMGTRSDTFDPNIEFILGVNSYIHEQDLDNIGNILEDCIKKHDEFLTPWKYVKKDET